MELYPDFYNDVFGPLMQPGSSSHTAGPCRMGYLASNLVKGGLKDITVHMDPKGSFAGIFGYMSEDIGMAGGALGFLPDDIRLFDARKICAERGISLHFEIADVKESSHNNALQFILTDDSGRKSVLTGNSIGGGMVEVVNINGYPVFFMGDTYVAMFQDARPEDKEDLEAAFGPYDCIESGISRNEEGKCLLWFKTAEDPSGVSGMDAENAHLLLPVLPVINNSSRKPQLFDTIEDWRRIVKERQSTMFDIAVEYEMLASGWPREKVIDQMRTIEGYMHRQCHAILDDGAKTLETPQDGNHYRQWDEYYSKGDYLVGDTIALALRYMYTARTSAPGVLFVPGPMGRGGGFVYAVLSAVKETKGYTEDDLLRGLFVSAGVGAVCYSRSNPTGETTGCTGDSGACMVMACGGLAEMIGCTPEQVENAASMALEISVGWPCDAIPGGYWQPCGERLTTAIVMAIAFADLAKSGKDHILPFHEVLAVADRMGRALGDDCHCTGRGGLCLTPTAQRYIKEFREKVEM